MLIITQVQTSDSGNYICTATAGQYVATSTTELTVGPGRGPSSAPVVVINPQYRQSRAGDMVSFTCEAEGSPQPSVSWSRLGGRALGPSVTVRGPELVISSVRKEDEGGYSCRATNSLGTAVTETVLYVSEAGGGAGGGEGWGEFGVRVVPEDVMLEAGERLELMCSVTSPGQYSVVWSRESGEMSAGAVQEDGVLTVLSSAPSDSGIYTCTVRGAGGRSQRTQARVTVRGGQWGPPQVSISPDDSTIGQGDSLELRCLVSGTGTTAWTKVGEDLADNIQVVGNTLVINQARVEDRGMYLCTVENAVGSSRATAIVEVEAREAPRLEIFPEISQTITSGGSVLYQCRAVAGIPSPEITWTRLDRRPLTANTEILPGGVLRITRVTGVEEGEYKCRAENIVGSVEVTASLTIHETPTIEMTPRGSVTVRVGQPLTINCFVTGDPAPTVSWNKITRSRDQC